jgi:ABC-type transport system substrate-binding protein
VIAICVGVCLLACRGGRTDPAITSQLKIGASVPRGGETDSGTRAIIRLLAIESPLSIGWDGRLAGRIFASWQWLTDEPGLRLRMRPNVFFHDGTPLTSELAAEILERVLRDALSSSIISITAEGQDVIIRTLQPEGFLPADLATVDFTPPKKNTVGTGPFKLVSSATDTSSLERFDGYYQGPPAIDRVDIVSYSTQRAAWASMMRNEINMLYQVSNDAVDFQEAESSIQAHTFVKAYSIGMVFNTRHPVFKSKEVRQALNEAVDRQRIVDVGMRNRGMVLDSPVWPYHWAYSAAQRSYSFNPSAARLRLDSAGFTEGREHEPGRMPSRFRFTCLSIADDPSLERVALLLQKQLFDIGIDMEVRSTPFREAGQLLATGKFDAALVPLIGSRSLNWLYIMWHSPAPDARPSLGSGYTAADRALDKLRAAIADDDVRSAVADVQQAFFDDPPAIFLAWTKVTRALTREFQVPDQGPRDIFGTIRQWQPVRPAMVARQQ